MGTFFQLLLAGRSETHSYHRRKVRVGLVFSSVLASKSFVFVGFVGLDEMEE